MGLLSTARTTRLMVTVEASQREMQWRRRVREIINTVIAPVCMEYMESVSDLLEDSFGRKCTHR